MSREAPVDHPVHELIRERWSPRNFDDRSVSPEDLLSLLEAARWAPSSYNEQPWSFIVACREQEEAFADILACLVPGNQTWAAEAPVLMLTVAKATFDRNGKPNRHAWHDVGLAVSQLTVEATARGLYVHQMAGIQPEEARRRFAIPEGHDAVTAIAIGYPGEPERAPSRRDPLEEMVFSDRWGEPSPLLDE